VTIIVEQRLVFKFGPSWQVAKYDEQPIHTKGIQVVQGPVRCLHKECPLPREKATCLHCHRELGVGTKAVDFVAVHDGAPYLIEVKDFREHRIETKDRLRDDLVIEVAFKVRDTLAGLVGAFHAGDKAVWPPLVAPILRKAPNVLLWLEYDDNDSEAGGDRGLRLSTLEDGLKRHLRWLSSSSHVSVTNKRLPPRVPGLVVDYLKAGIFDLRERMRTQRYVSRDDFCTAWPATQQEAGVKLKKLCDHGFLRPPEGKGDRDTAGPRWDQFHEEPGETSR
jgi:hypothetical protein